MHQNEITSQIASREGRTILFVKTQRGPDRLADKLASVRVPVGALHGGKSQAVRGLTSLAGVYPKFVDVRPHHKASLTRPGNWRVVNYRF